MGKVLGFNDGKLLECSSCACQIKGPLTDTGIISPVEVIILAHTCTQAKQVWAHPSPSPFFKPSGIGKKKNRLTFPSHSHQLWNKMAREKKWKLLSSCAFQQGIAVNYISRLLSYSLYTCHLISLTYTILLILLYHMCIICVSPPFYRFTICLL